MSGINRKGLTKGVECKSVPGATVDITDSLQILDITKFDNIIVIVYVERNNASNGTDFDTLKRSMNNWLNI